MKAPVLLLTFNRLETTKRVLEQIRQYAPSKLYVVNDGARSNKTGEDATVAQVRDLVLRSIDWPCEVITRFRDENLGCGKGVSDGINWFFKQEPAGIILEDDCLPNLDFFNYCEELLELYRDDEKVMHIGGDASYLFSNQYDEYSYRFTNYPHVWGWASWRRAWQHYDYNLNFEFDDLNLEAKLQNQQAVEYWKDIWQVMTTDPLDTWDYQWIFSIWRRNGIAISPNSNLISNIGFSQTATHTFSDSIVANASLQKLEVPLKHPPKYQIYTKTEELDFLVTSTGLLPWAGWRKTARSITNKIVPKPIRRLILERLKKFIYRI